MQIYNIHHMVLKVYLSEPMEKVKRIEMTKNNEVGGPKRKIFSIDGLEHISPLPLE